MLTLTRDLVALRRDTPELRRGAYATLPQSDEELWVWQRGEAIVVAVNMSDASRSVDVGNATILLSTRRERDGEAIGDAGRVELAPWEAVIARRA